MGCDFSVKKNRAADIRTSKASCFLKDIQKFKFNLPLVFFRLYTLQQQ